MESGQMRWTTLVYLPEELGEQERFLKRATEGNGIRMCPVTKNEILGTAGDDWAEALGIVPEECLMIAGSEEVMRAGRKEKIAILPYRGPEVSAGRFSGEPYVMEGFEEVDARFLERRFQRCHDIPWVIGETERCVIRELGMEDLPALFEMYSQPGITEHMAGLFPRDEEYDYQRKYIDNVYRYYEFGMWLVFEKSTGRLIGRVGIDPRGYPADQKGDIADETEISVMELGYAIVPDHQRQGFADEVCREVIRIAFQEYGAEDLHCLIQPGNIPSIRLAEKLGFDFIGNMHMDGQDFQHYILTGNSCNF